MENKHDITKENWYYTQVFGDDGLSYYTITFANNIDQAKQIINKWLDFHKANGRRDINLYHKNYKRAARKAVDAGQFIDQLITNTPCQHIPA